MVFSPVDIQIISPSGERMGKKFENGDEYNEIEGAFYTGFDTDTEFLTIPNPEDGEYKILTEGMGAGNYEIEIAKITENEEGETKESSIMITGVTEPEKQEEAIVKVEGMSVEKLTVATEPPDNPDQGGGNNNGNQNETGSSSGTGDQSKDRADFRGQTDIQKIEDLKGKVRAYFLSGQIKVRKEAKIITERLNHIRVHLKRYLVETSSKKMNVEKRKASRHIQELIEKIRRDCPKKIDEEARDYIVGILEELKIE
jgi:hypothetical protein